MTRRGPWWSAAGRTCISGRIASRLGVMERGRRRGEADRRVGALPDDVICVLSCERRSERLVKPEGRRSGLLTWVGALPVAGLGTAAGWRRRGWVCCPLVMAGAGRTGVEIAGRSPPLCHVRAYAGHPRLAVLEGAKSWLAGPGPAMTQWQRQWKRHTGNDHAACPTNVAHIRY